MAVRLEKSRGWYDDYLLKEERGRQASSRAAIAKKRKAAVDSGEMKFVPTYNAVADTREEINDYRNRTSNASKNQLRLENARRMKNNSNSGIRYSDNTVRSKLKEAFAEKQKKKVR